MDQVTAVSDVRVWQCTTDTRDCVKVAGTRGQGDCALASIHSQSELHKCGRQLSQCAHNGVEWASNTPVVKVPGVKFGIDPPGYLI